ncbi:MAG: YaaR family protein [Treponema sp.]|jgi:uncharacterized protein YaaR (DUF327 family)|nr:YaaR family protein [Treponema sp.]
MAKITEGLPPFNPAAYTVQPGEAKKERLRGGAPTEKARPVRFAALLEETAAEPLPPDAGGDLQELLDEVHGSGDDLKQRPFPEEVKRYKKAVRNFLRYIVERGYTAEQQTGIPNSLKPGFNWRRGAVQSRDRTVYTLIQVADRKLEQLAAGILAGQITQLELLARVDEINGILIDLVR